MSMSEYDVMVTMVTMVTMCINRDEMEWDAQNPDGKIEWTLLAPTLLHRQRQHSMRQTNTQHITNRKHLHVTHVTLPTLNARPRSASDAIQQLYRRTGLSIQCVKLRKVSGFLSLTWWGKRAACVFITTQHSEKSRRIHDIFYYLQWHKSMNIYSTNKCWSFDPFLMTFNR